MMTLKLHATITLNEWDGAPKKVFFLQKCGIIAIATDKYRVLIFKKSPRDHRSIYTF